MPDIFEKRGPFKPFEYPEAEGFRDAINHSYWLVSEWHFMGDKHDYSQMTPAHQEVLKRSLLAISQIEVSVKKFWAKLGDRFPKAEIDQVGITFGESEVRHAEAYSHLLTVLDMQGDFDALLQVPAIKARVAYLSSFMSKMGGTPEDYAFVLTLFSSFIENVSLFSQFAIVKSFNKQHATLKDIDNVIQATQKEEQIHFLFGAWLVNTIRKEQPGWFGPEFWTRIRDAALDAFFAEREILYWIFESGELPWLPLETLETFIMQRINESVEAIGGQPVFAILHRDKLKPLQWFTEEIHASVSVDFFHKRSVDYTKGDKSIKAEDLYQ